MRPHIKLESGGLGHPCVCINAHVNVLSQIDNDGTVNNALQIFSGKISSFGYRNNTIILDVISNRPFQNVTLPQLKTNLDYKLQRLNYYSRY